MNDPFALARFVEAQAAHYDTALRELRIGANTTHWMWFVFPQFAGHGHSEMSRRYAIRSRAEAAAYLDHPVLGPRIRACVQALLAHHELSARDIHERDVAIKVLHPDLGAALGSERFLREIRTTTRLQHPYTLPCIAIIRQ